MCEKVMNARVLHSVLIPQRNPTPPGLDTSQHPSRERFMCLTARAHTMTLSLLHALPRFNTLPVRARPHTSHITTSESGTQGSRRLEGEKVSRSIPSVGMKFRGPGSSGNAELAVRSSQHSRKKEGWATVTIATQRRSLWKFEKAQKKKKKVVSGC